MYDAQSEARVDLRVAQLLENMGHPRPTDVRQSDPHPFYVPASHLINIVICALPSMAQVLQEISQTARENADAGPLSQKPSVPGAARAYFMARLSHHFRECYGRPLYEVVAATATAVFGETVGANLVKNIVAKRKR